MIPEGKYQAIAVPDDDGKWMVFGTADNEKKTRQVSVRLKITDGEHANTERTWIGFFTDKTVDKTIEQLRNLGAQGDDMSKWPTEALTEPVTIVIKHEADLEGVMRERVAWINRPGGGGFQMKNKLEGADLLNFAAQLRAKVASKPAIKREAPKATSNGVDL